MDLSSPPGPKEKPHLQGTFPNPPCHNVCLPPPTPSDCPKTDHWAARSTANISIRARKQRLVAWNVCTAMEEIGNCAPTISSKSVWVSLSAALESRGISKMLSPELRIHWLTNMSVNAGHTEIARRHGCASQRQVFRWARMLMIVQTTERNEAKRKESKGLFSK